MALSLVLVEDFSGCDFEGADFDPLYFDVEGFGWKMEIAEENPLTLELVAET